MRSILAIETSTLTTSVALVDGAGTIARDGGPVGAHTGGCEAIASHQARALDGSRGLRPSPVTAGAAHSSDLFALIEAVLAAAGRALAEVDGFAVGAGPGSFTGLRIGMATAKGLAFATGRRLTAVSSLAALALDAAPFAGADALLVPLIDARRGELFAGFYRAAAGVVDAVAEDRVLAPGELGAAIAAARGAASAAVVLAGDGAPLVEALALGEVARGARATPSAAAVGALALAGRGVDGLHGGPTYLRQAEAEIKFPPGSPPPGSFAGKKPAR